MMTSTQRDNNNQAFNLDDEEDIIRVQPPPIQRRGYRGEDSIISDLVESVRTLVDNSFVNCCFKHCCPIAAEDSSGFGALFLAGGIVLMGTGPVLVELNINAYKQSTLRGLFTTIITAAGMISTGIAVATLNTGNPVTSIFCQILLTSLSGVLSALLARATMRCISPLPSFWAKETIKNKNPTKLKDKEKALSPTR
jgi:hypothetical protein